MFALPLHIIVCLIALVGITSARIHDRCDFARTLRYKHQLPLSEINVWACIAQYQSGFNSEAIGYDIDGTAYYGMFQISDRYWCNPSEEQKNACDISCSRLLDDDLTDDFACIKNIFNEHQRISGNGYDAWTSYKNTCQYVYDGLFTDDCFVGDIDYIPNTTPTMKKAIARKKSRIYDRCELARELWYVHQLPADQIATWVCIAKHESNYNTSAVGYGDHGLFQISDIYWCSPPGRGWVCGLSCAKLEDSDISDDVECMKKIYSEHERLSGDGFNAWTVYRPFCKGRSDKYIEGCFDYSDLNSIDPYSYETNLESGATTSHEVKSYAEKPKEKPKIFERCELATELHQKHKIPIELVPTYVCIAYHESRYNTSAVGHLNSDGSGDHGIFQISDIYWCSPPGTGRACGLSCDKLEDSDISDDVKCMKKIYDEHQQLSGDGFNAWSVYDPYCKNQSDVFVDGCFNEVSNSLVVLNHRPAVTAPSVPYRPVEYSSKLHSSDNREVHENIINFEKSTKASTLTTPVTQPSTSTSTTRVQYNTIANVISSKVYTTTPSTVRYTTTVSNRIVPKSTTSTEATHRSTSAILSERERVQSLFEIYFNGFRTRPPTTLKSIISTTSRTPSSLVFNTVKSTTPNPLKFSTTKKISSSNLLKSTTLPQINEILQNNYTSKRSSAHISSVESTTNRPFRQQSTTATVNSKITYQSIFGQRPSVTTLQSLPAYYINRLTTTTTKSPPSINQIIYTHDNSISSMFNNRITRAPSSSTLNKNFILTSSEHIQYDGTTSSTSPSAAAATTTTTTTHSPFDRIFDLFVH